MTNSIEAAKDQLLGTLNAIDRDKLSLPELKTYAETLKIVSDIQTKSYAEYLSELSSGLCGGFKPTTVSELKGGADNGVQ